MEQICGQRGAKGDEWVASHGENLAYADPKTVEAALAVAEKDRPVLAAALRLGREALVTGDRTHFGDFYRKRIAGVTIHPPVRWRMRSKVSEQRTRCFVSWPNGEIFHSMRFARW